MIRQGTSPCLEFSAKDSTFVPIDNTAHVINSAAGYCANCYLTPLKLPMLDCREPSEVLHEVAEVAKSLFDFHFFVRTLSALECVCVSCTPSVCVSAPAVSAGAMVCLCVRDQACACECLCLLRAALKWCECAVDSLHLQSVVSACCFSSVCVRCWWCLRVATCSALVWRRAGGCAVGGSDSQHDCRVYSHEVC